MVEFLQGESQNTHGFPLVSLAERTHPSGFQSTLVKQWNPAEVTTTLNSAKAIILQHRIAIILRREQYHDHFTALEPNGDYLTTHGPRIDSDHFSPHGDCFATSGPHRDHFSALTKTPFTLLQAIAFAPSGAIGKTNITSTQNTRSALRLPNDKKHPRKSNRFKNTRSRASA